MYCNITTKVNTEANIYKYINTLNTGQSNGGIDELLKIGHIIMWTEIEEQIYVKEKGEALNTTINSPKDLDDLEGKSSKM